MKDKNPCPECGKEMVYVGDREAGGLGMPNRLVKGYRCPDKNCIGGGRI